MKFKFINNIQKSSSNGYLYFALDNYQYMFNTINYNLFNDPHSHHSVLRKDTENKYSGE